LGDDLTRSLEQYRKRARFDRDAASGSGAQHRPGLRVETEPPQPPGACPSRPL